MELSEMKIEAKKILVKNYAKLFSASFFPYVTIFSLVVLNYYVYILLKETDFSFSPLVSSYAGELRPVLMTLSVSVSFVLWRFVRLFTDAYFFRKSRNASAGYFESIKSLSAKQIFACAGADVLKFFISAGWAAFFLSPSVITAGTFYYALKDGSYSKNVLSVLAASCAALFAAGCGFLYTALKRYSMSRAVIFENPKTDSLKAVEKSIALMEGRCLKYSAYCVSLWGWAALCLFIIPAVYVLPYNYMAKCCYFNAVTNKRKQPKTEKPVIFYISAKAGVKPVKTPAE